MYAQKADAVQWDCDVACTGKVQEWKQGTEDQQQTSHNKDRRLRKLRQAFSLLLPKNLQQDPCSDDSMAELFAMADADGNGKASVEELADMVGDELAQAIVDAGDTDADGQLDMEEFTAFVQCNYCGIDDKCPGQADPCQAMVEEFMHVCDADKNGMIEACEAYACAFLLEGQHREESCPSWYDSRVMTVDSCKPCLAGSDSFVPLEYYGLPSCSSSGAQKTVLESLSERQKAFASLPPKTKLKINHVKKTKAEAKKSVRKLFKLVFDRKVRAVLPKQ